MSRIGPWLPRAGAALAVAGFFLPHASVDGRSRSPFTLCMELGEFLTLAEYLYHVLWLLASLGAPLLLLSAATRRDPDRGGLRWVLLVWLLLSSFSLSTLASILLTAVAPDPLAPRPSEGLLLALFVVPLACAAVAVGRVLAGGDARATGRLVRASLGLLVALHALFLAGHWWLLFGTWVSAGGPPARTLAGAWAPFAGGLLVVLGEVHLLARPLPPAPAAEAGA